MPAKQVLQAVPAGAVAEPRPLGPVAAPPPADARAEEVEYPSSDGLPMADNTYQMKAMADMFHMLREHFRARDDVFVAGDLLVYYEPGNARVSVAPDVMVVRGVPAGDRLSYKTWEEGKVPDWVMEVASDGTMEQDSRRKPGTYAGMGVPEYWQFDPRGGLLPRRLRGRRLRGRRYEDLPAERRAGEGIAIASPVLGLRVECEGGRLRFWDPVGREYLRSPAEAEQARRKETQARRKAEDRVKELEALLKSLEVRR